MRMTGASGSAEPCEVCVLNKDEFYHLEGWELPWGARGRRWPVGQPQELLSARGRRCPCSLSLLCSLVLFFFFLFDLVFFFFFALDRWRKKAPSFWGGQREENIPLCPLPTALSSPKTCTRRQPGRGHEEPGEERSSPSTVEKQNCGSFSRSAQFCWAIS